MKLNDRVLEVLAEMVVGDHNLFPYRSSSYITRFFERCGLPFVHDGSTRKWWAKERLAELNLGVCDQADLPANDLLTVISELFEPVDFEKANARGGSPITVEAALEGLNKLLKRQGLVAYLHESGKCFLRNTGSGVDSVSIGRAPRPLSKEETEQRERLTTFLDSASEDEFTERVLVPLFQRLGFHRVSMAGHRREDSGVRQGSVDEISAADQPLAVLLRTGEAWQD